METIYRIRRVMDEVLMAITSVFFGAGVIAAFIAAFTRKFTHSSGFVWADEFTRYVMIWATMLVVGKCMRDNVMTAFTLVIDRLPKKGQLCFRILIQLMVLGFYSLILIFGWRMSVTNTNLIAVSLDISMMYVYLIWPISAALVLYEGATCLLEMGLELAGKRLPDNAAQK